MQRSNQLVGVLVFAVLVAASGGANAQSGFGQTTPYLGVDLITLTNKVTDNTGAAPLVTGTADTTTVRLRGGLVVTSWLSGEIHILVPRTDTFSNTGVDNTVKTNVTGIYAKPNYTLGPVNAYALLGFASAYITLEGAYVGKQRASGASYGLGLGYVINRNWSLNVDYMHYFKEAFPVVGVGGTLDFKGDAVGIGLAYTFGR